MPGLKHIRGISVGLDQVGRMAWSPNGKQLAIPHGDMVEIWDFQRGCMSAQVSLHRAFSVEWLPNGRELLVCSAGDSNPVLKRFVLANSTSRWVHQLKDGAFPVACLSGSSIVLTSNKKLSLINAVNGAEEIPPDSIVRDGLSATISSRSNLLYAITSERLLTFNQRLELIYSNPSLVSINCYSMAISRKEKYLAWGSGQAICVTRVGEWGSTEIQRHTRVIESLAFADTDELLVSRSLDGTTAFWNVASGTRVGELQHRPSERWPAGIAFNTKAPILATLDDKDTTVHLWEVDSALMLNRKSVRRSKDVDVSRPRPSGSTQYQNAKVLLVGNSSVGKSGLGMVLAGKKWKRTDSTHARHLWPLTPEKVKLENGLYATQETILWDLAGQAGYRIVHGLHLGQVAVALVCFDASSETDPFAGVAYWARALDEATCGFPLVKFLVAARCDRGAPQVSQQRIEEICERYGFSGYHMTSGKRGDGIEKLTKSIRLAIDWSKLPHISTETLFKKVRVFLLAHKREGRVVASETDLRAEFRRKMTVDDAAFSVVLDQLESAGLARRLDFGGHVLLQPELLDAYCGWMTYAAREEPDGLGELDEDEAKRGGFKMDDDRALRDKPAQEAVLLAATVQEAVRRNLAWRQPTEGGVKLVFPSEPNPELPDYPGGYSLAVAFRFEGPVAGIYATLAVQLLNSRGFRRKDLFKNAALFLGADKGVCGFAVDYPDRKNDSLGRLTVFFEPETTLVTRRFFLRYINAQIEGLALKGTVLRERIYHCGKCDETIQASVVQKRRKLGEKHVMCPVCNQTFALDDLAEASTESDPAIQEMTEGSDEEREKQSRLSILAEREARSQFHAFLCHNSKDKPHVRKLARMLREQGVLPWLDEDSLLAGDRWPRKLEKALDEAGVIVVCIGAHGHGRWQDMEYQVALQRAVEDRDKEGRSRVRLIPVLLPGAQSPKEWPAFLRGFHGIDLSSGVEDGKQIVQLVQAILRPEM